MKTENGGKFMIVFIIILITAITSYFYFMSIMPKKAPPDNKTNVVTSLLQIKSKWEIIEKNFYLQRNLTTLNSNSFNNARNSMSKFKYSFKYVTIKSIDEEDTREIKNVVLLLNNATEELIDVFSDTESYEFLIDNANKEVQLANKELDKLVKRYQINIRPIPLIRKGLDTYETY